MWLGCACPFRQRRELLQERNIVFREGKRLSRKNFKNSVDPTPSMNRQDNDRTKTKPSADLHIDYRIIFSIRTNLDTASS
jgi:hypothetical protein